jgi:hypothetical protein
MKTLQLSTWASLHDTVARLRAEYGTHEFPLGDGRSFVENNHILFRGHADSRWSLQTTLERRSVREFDELAYVELAIRSSREIESLTGQAWSVPSYPEVEAVIRSRSHGSFLELPAYDYLVYLRHHGFPSPLLDWTESPFIAAYFAYAEVKSADPAVYCYIESVDGGKGGWESEPQIHLMGPNVRTHPRHFTQKAWYTVATEWDAARRRHVFCNHEKVFARNDETQDVLVKLVLPLSERQVALRALNDFNINHYTLFQTEDSLVAAIASRHFDLDQRGFKSSGISPIDATIAASPPNDR